MNLEVVKKVLDLLRKIDGITEILDTVEKENGVFEYTLSRLKAMEYE